MWERKKHSAQSSVSLSLFLSLCLQAVNFTDASLSPAHFFVLFCFVFSSTSLLLPTYPSSRSWMRAQSCNPMDCSLPGSSVHGLFQASIQERVDISFSILPPFDGTGWLEWIGVEYFPFLQVSYALIKPQQANLWLNTFF